MKRAFFLLCILIFGASSAFGFQLGPATPAVDHGEVNLGLGYFYKEAEWDDIDIEQNRIYLHLGYGMGIENEPRWEAYLRGGVADLEAADFDSDFEPVFAGGIKGEFHKGRYFGWGMVAQGAYFFDWEDDNGMAVEEAWEIEAGFPVQVQLGPALIYLGPVAFYTEATAKSGAGETDLEEDNNFGGFGGFCLDFGPFSFEAEAQYKSDFSGGGMVSVQF